MPGVMDPGKCYWWFHNGCRYRVLGTDNAPCAPFPGTPHNEGRYGGATTRLPNDPFCEESCSQICTGSPIYHVPPAEWKPGCGCGAVKSVTFLMNGAKCCGCDCDTEAPLNAACSKTCPSASIELSLRTWPMGWVWESAGCSTVSTDCVSCKPTGAPNDVPGIMNLTSLVGSPNHCDANCPDVDPCDPSNSPPCEGGVGVACSASGSVAISLEGNPNAPFQFGFSITRSCPEGSCSEPPTWFDGGPVAGGFPAIVLCKCTAPGNPCNCCGFMAPDGTPGTNAYELAKTINSAFGAGSGGCVTYNAVGVKEAWLGNSYACIADEQGNLPSQNPCHECIYEPCVWIGPFLSNCNTTATWLYANVYKYKVDASYGCANRSFFNLNNQRCQCTGSPDSGVGGSWTSDQSIAVEFKYSEGGGCPQFPPLVEVSASPCVPLPTIS